MSIRREAKMKMLKALKKAMLSEAAVKKVVRRSIFAKVNIPKGTTIAESMLAIKRPGTGLEPKYISTVIGKKTKANIRSGEPVTFEKLL